MNGLVGDLGASVQMDTGALKTAAEQDCPTWFKTDEFRMYCFKILPCSKRYSHDWTTCPFSHPGEKAKRRDPRSYQYTGIACPEMKKTGECPRGDQCPYAHNVFEYWMHPSRYRSQLCNDGTNCKRKCCFFAHTIDELRVPSQKPSMPGDSSTTLTPILDSTPDTDGYPAALPRTENTMDAPSTPDKLDASVRGESTPSQMKSSFDSDRRNSTDSGPKTERAFPDLTTSTTGSEIPANIRHYLTVQQSSNSHELQANIAALQQLHRMQQMAAQHQAQLDNNYALRQVYTQLLAAQQAQQAQQVAAMQAAQQAAAVQAAQRQQQQQQQQQQKQQQDLIALQLQHQLSTLSLGSQGPPTPQVATAEVLQSLLLQQQQQQQQQQVTELAAEQELQQQIQRQSLDLGAFDFAQEPSLLAQVPQRRFSVDVASVDQSPLLSTGMGLTLPQMPGVSSYSSAAHPVRNSVDNSGLPVYPLRASSLYGSSSQTHTLGLSSLASEIVPENAVAPVSQSDALLTGVQPRRTGASLDFGAQQRHMLLSRLSMDGSAPSGRRVGGGRLSSDLGGLEFGSHVRLSMDGLDGLVGARGGGFPAATSSALLFDKQLEKEDEEQLLKDVISASQRDGL